MSSVPSRDLLDHELNTVSDAGVGKLGKGDISGLGSTVGGVGKGVGSLLGGLTGQRAQEDE